MAVGITRTALPAPTASSSGVSTLTGVSIGTASADRKVVLSVVSEANTSFDAATIDFGGGAVSMTPIHNDVAQGSMHARSWIADAPTGTTATFTVTVGGSLTTTNWQPIVHAVTGAHATFQAQGTDASTDMDSTDPLTTGSQTIPSGGGFIGFAGGATDTVAKSWANATVDVEQDSGTLRATSATRTTSGTVTITCTGTTNGEDGVLTWMIFKQATVVVNVEGILNAVSGSASDLLRKRLQVGSMDSVSTFGAPLNRTRGIAGSMNSVSTFAGALNRTAFMASTAIAISTLAGHIQAARPFVGSMASISALSGEFGKQKLLEGLMSSVSVMQGDISKIILFAGAMPGISVLSGSMDDEFADLGVKETFNVIKPKNIDFVGLKPAPVEL